MKRIAVFISGSGTNLQALIDHSKNASGSPFEIALVVSNKLSAFGLKRAESAGIPTLTHLLKPYKDEGKSRIQYDLDLVEKIKHQTPTGLDLIVLAGFMHILSAEFINSFPENRIINLHPALPGCFDGARAIERAYEAFEKKEIQETGVMVHWCIPEVDRGQVIIQEICPIKQGDTLADLEKNIHEIEHKLIVQDDKSQLIAMGFVEAVVVKALKKTGNAGLQPALDWIVANPNDDGKMEEAPEDDGEVTEESAQSLKCDDCGKLLRDATAAEMHAIKTQHTNFSESTMAIKPLTAEEKAQKVQELKERLARRKEEKRLAEIEEAKEKEKIRRVTGAEMQLIREKLEKEQMAKEVEERRRQKEADRIAKENVKRQLEADKLERKRQAEERKMMAAGQSISAVASTMPASASNVSSKDYANARIQIRVTSGPPLTKVFSANDSLSVVYDFCKQSGVTGDFKLMQTFPRKVLAGADLSRTLNELGLVPSAALVIQ